MNSPIFQKHQLPLPQAGQIPSPTDPPKRTVTHRLGGPPLTPYNHFLIRRSSQRAVYCDRRQSANFFMSRCHAGLLFECSVSFALYTVSSAVQILVWVLSFDCSEKLPSDTVGSLPFEIATLSSECQNLPTWNGRSAHPLIIQALILGGNGNALWVILLFPFPPTVGANSEGRRACSPRVRSFCPFCNMCEPHVL